jgi:hypothetical protein
MKIIFTCPHCGDHHLVCKTSWETQKEQSILGIDEDEGPIFSEDPASEGFWEGNEVEEFLCGNQKCSAPVSVGHPSFDEVVALGLKEGWIKKVEE